MARTLSWGMRPATNANRWPRRKHQTSSSADALDPSTKYPSLGWYVAARSSSSSSGTSSACGVGGARASGGAFFEGEEPHP